MVFMIKFLYLPMVHNKLKIKNLSMRFILLCMVLFSLSLQLNAQGFFVEEAYYTADDHVAFGEYSKALPLFKDIEKNDPDNANIHYQLGVCYYHLNDIDKASQYLLKAIQKTSLKYTGDANEKNAPVYSLFYMGKVCLAQGKVDEAMTYHEKYRGYLSKGNKNLHKDVDREMGYCYNAKKFMKYPVDVAVTNLGTTLNSTYEDYSPVSTGDGKSLIFTSRRKGSTGNLLDNDMKYYEDIYISQNTGSGWGTPDKISPFINSNEHESALSISADGTTLFIYKSIASNGDIFVSKLENGKWTTPKALNSAVNSKYQETHACVSPDGKSLYFVSNRNGGFGGKDIYKSILQPDGTWGKAVNMGPNINTPFDEEAPFIHTDGKTMFFSSQGRESMGGFDVFTSKLSADGFWSVPQNIGYPLNTTADDVFYNPSPDPTVSYFSSVRPEGQGGQDIYEVKIKREKELFAVIKGAISDPVSFKPIDAKIVIQDAATNETVALVLADDSTGNYDVSLPANKDYNIAYSSDNFETKSESIKIEESQKGKEISKNVQLTPTGAPATPVAAPEVSVAPPVAKPAPAPKPTPVTTASSAPKSASNSFPLELVDKQKTSTKQKSYDLSEENYAEGEKFVMNNIYYDYGKATLRSESMDELNRLVNFMKKLKNIRVEVSGHTDNISSASFNKDLSRKRAKAVVNYLVKSGISANRLEFEGYGLDQPIETNTTEEGRKANRRTEIKIISNGKLLSASAHNANASSLTRTISDSEIASSSSSNKAVTGGTLYRVQFASSTGERSTSDPVFKGLTNIYVYQLNGMYKYAVGSAGSKAELQSLLEEVKGLGFTDAFIVGFGSDGQRSNAQAAIAAAPSTHGSSEIYRIQVTAISQRKPVTSPDFKGLQGLVVEESNGIYKYYLGKETSYVEALRILEEVKAKGFNSAFIKKL